MRDALPWIIGGAAFLYFLNRSPSVVATPPATVGASGLPPATYTQAAAGDQWVGSAKATAILNAPNATTALAVAAQDVTNRVVPAVGQTIQQAMGQAPLNQTAAQDLGNGQWLGAGGVIIKTSSFIPNMWGQELPQTAGWTR